MYTIEGDTIKKAPTCPRCGPGIFLMNTDKRQYCGKCHYTEFKTSQKPAEKPVEKATA